MSNEEDKLLLKNQLCFSLYAASRAVTRLYQPSLSALGLTYPQYIVMLILWEKDQQLVGEIGKAAQLNTNTLTPLLKRLEANGLITRQRLQTDERRCIIQLTDEGFALKEQCQCLPTQLLAQSRFSLEKALQLKDLLDEFLEITSQE
ncbi:MarR family transcriptional regulator [Pseudoalteromonas xiamenensis]|uniref:MarR family winged helix-turn-helix transcriptional regulator n=1 Tax=Pseudoalteromonas xiamenensis TaxID=882626 RepID=UPI0027E3D0D5|nr:MarR family transcriptional regulator [Pseudoalteromonas xiamenensis]WMN58466.1 MarR family transcriptional regulator [Pseudoalteromonas xiamenensis]